MLGLALVVSAHAEDTGFTGSFYFDTWKLDAAVVAPWADPHAKPDESEKNALITADMLFQGAFEDMHDKDKKAEPRKLAASLGFTGASIKTLETGCEIDWHFVDAATAQIGLDYYVYTLKKQ